MVVNMRNNKSQVPESVITLKKSLDLNCQFLYRIISLVWYKVTSCRSSDHFTPPPYQTAPNSIPTKLGLKNTNFCIEEGTLAILVIAAIIFKLQKVAIPFWKGNCSHVQVV